MHPAPDRLLGDAEVGHHLGDRNHAAAGDRDEVTLELVWELPELGCILPDPGQFGQQSSEQTRVNSPCRVGVLPRSEAKRRWEFIQLDPQDLKSSAIVPQSGKTCLSGWQSIRALRVLRRGLSLS